MFIAWERKSQCHKVIINAFWKAPELTDKACFGGKSYSCFVYHLTLASTPKEVSTHQLLWSLLRLQGESHSGLLYFVTAEFPTSKSCSTLWSIGHRTVHQRDTSHKPIVKCITFVSVWSNQFCFLFIVYKLPDELLPCLGKGAFVNWYINKTALSRPGKNTVNKFLAVK